ncbi:PhzF family phenazine biosynthesis protein [Piscinibacter sp.]|uniref:PhzF family phenazine biosynthesis protein n=1 Tax=Piscinibacter sp. TaxID=1903157 RepID=UPI001B594537|nr:PhzF family phenazine biosynthesis protein [Piscinibacter sp.]MBK7532207.1 PhzF family phenazine biosynthesis protein [Piscinibacter sp.]MBP6542112.1 PhzF family phenazine biosynthesis protein [Piscinibacter sp.]
MSRHVFTQLDVFTDTPLRGNPLAVVHAAQGLSDANMQAFARWTNLSETTFLLPPTEAGADYRVRIFTPDRELPFAGHPTLGSCQAWLAAGGQPRSADEVVQQCGVGLVRIRRDGTRLAFAAPPLRRSGPVEPEVFAQIVRSLRIPADAIRASNWVDNGPGWVAVMLGSRDEVLALQPDFAAMRGLELGVVAPWSGGEAQFEVRAFVPSLGVPEDPVTGSLNAGLAQWLIGAGLAPERYVASQGTALGRSGRVFVEKRSDTVWIGGDSVVVVSGQVSL